VGGRGLAGNSVVAEVALPKGTPALHMNANRVSREFDYEFEDELLLPSDIRWKVIAVKKGRGKSPDRIRLEPVRKKKAAKSE
jgi:hypothetical protein